MQHEAVDHWRNPYDFADACPVVVLYLTGSALGQVHATDQTGCENTAVRRIGKERTRRAPRKNYETQIVDKVIPLVCECVCLFCTLKSLIQLKINSK